MVLIFSLRLIIYFNFIAGAEVIITDSYQASVPGFMKYLGCDKTASYNLIKESVKLASQARQLYLDENPEGEATFY